MSTASWWSRFWTAVRAPSPPPQPPEPFVCAWCVDPPRDHERCTDSAVHLPLLRELPLFAGRTGRVAACACALHGHTGPPQPLRPPPWPRHVPPPPGKAD
jgi:hypothetical protein